MEERNLVLWLANGHDLGSKSLIRLAATMAYALKTGDTIVVAAGVRPDLVATATKTMAEMAAEQLIEWGFDKKRIVTLHAAVFKTTGELRTFMEFKTTGRRTIVSGDWHLRRARKLFIQMYGRAAADQIVWEPALLDRLDTFGGKVLEGCKWVHLCLPTRLQGPADVLFVRVVGHCS